MQMFVDEGIEWSGGKAPPDEPACGFDGHLCQRRVGTSTQVRTTKNTSLHVPIGHVHVGGGGGLRRRRSCMSRATALCADVQMRRWLCADVLAAIGSLLVLALLVALVSAFLMHRHAMCFCCTTRVAPCRSLRRLLCRLQPTCSYTIMYGAQASRLRAED